MENVGSGRPVFGLLSPGQAGSRGVEFESCLALISTPSAAAPAYLRTVAVVRWSAIIVTSPTCGQRDIGFEFLAPLGLFHICGGQISHC